MRFYFNILLLFLTTLISCNNDDFIDETYEINIINIDGSGKTTVLEEIGLCVSPQFVDTDNIIYYDYGYNISTLEITSKIPQFLVNGRFPTVSNNGSKIAFTTSIVDWAEGLSAEDNNKGYHLALMNTDGSNKQLLTFPEDDSTEEYVFNFAFSINDDYIVFNRSIYSPDTNYTTIARQQIGYQPIELIKTVDNWGVFPFLLPNNEEIVFTTGNQYHGEILKYNVNTEETTKIVDVYQCSGLDISRDGKNIVYSTARGLNNDIFIIDVDGNNKKRLSSTKLNNISPKFSPDGTKIVYVAEFDYLTANIIIVNSDGSGKLKLTNDDDMRNQYTSFSMDGSKIIYSTMLWGTRLEY